MLLMLLRSLYVMCRGLQSALAGLRGTGPVVSLSLDVIGDISTAADADQAAAGTSGRPCAKCGSDHRLPPKAPGSAAKQRVDGKEAAASSSSSSRAFSMFGCHWGNCKTKEDDCVYKHPYVRVRLKVGLSC